MPTAEIQTSLNAGELSPNLYARTDLTKFESGAALLRNFFVDFRGGVSNRAGTKFIAACKTIAGAKRLLPFIVSTQAAYLLEFGNLYIRIYLAGALVDEVVTPYLAADLVLLKYTQSADVLTLVHPSYPPANLSRQDATTFSYDLITVGTTMGPPTITTMTAPHSGPYSFGYLITAVDIDGKEESLPSNPGVKHSEGMNETTNRVIGMSYSAPPQGVSAYNIYKWGPVDAVTMNPATVWGFIGTSQTTTFTDINIAPDFSKQPPGWGDPFSGGQFQSIVVNAPGSGYDGVSGDWPVIPFVPLTITGDGTGASGYAVIDHALGTIIGVYMTNPGKNYTNATVTAVGQGGTGATFTFTFSDPAPVYPGCTAYIQQRRAFAGSIPKPETLVLSQVGLYNNFNTTPVSLSTDAIVASIAGEQVNTIKAMVPVSYGLLLFTTSQVVLLNGGTPYASIAPDTISFQSQSAVGANDLAPLRINTDILYTQNKGNRVRNLAYAWQKQAYQGSDISALAAHLFDGFSVPEWCWAEEPFKIVWAVRDDGRLLSLTYVPDQEVAAWCRHDTQGSFKSVCSIPEDGEDAVYVIVERYIPANNPHSSDPSGNWVLYIERMASRQGCCIFDAWHLDCALSLPTPAPIYPLYLSGTTGAITLNSFGQQGGFPDPSGIQSFTTVQGSNLNASNVGVSWVSNRVFINNPSGGTCEISNLTAHSSVVEAASVIGNTIARYGEDGHPYPFNIAGNSAQLFKLNPVTMAVISSFGGFTGGFATDSTHWAYPADYDTILLDNVQYIVSVAFQPGQTNNEVAVLNATTMAWTGFKFHADEPFMAVTKGLPIGGAGTAWIVSQRQQSYYFGVYYVSITPSVCAMTKVSATLASTISPGWTHVSSNAGVVLDETDGNILAHFSATAAPAWANSTSYSQGDTVSSGGHDYGSKVNTNVGNAPASSPTQWVDLGPSGPTENRLVKINVNTGAIMWSILTLAAATTTNFSDSRILNSTFCYLDPAPVSSGVYDLRLIDTIAGTQTVVVVKGVTNINTQSFDAQTGELFMICEYHQGTGTPVPLGSTPTDFSHIPATFGLAPRLVGPFTNTGQVVQIGCGKVRITAVANSTQATGTVIADLEGETPNDPNGTPLPILAGDWTLTTPVSTLSGLDHLEGKEVWALSDGVVVEPLTVAGGSVTLPTPATNIVVGLQYTQQIKTLYLTMDDLQQGSIQGKRKLIPAVTLRVDCTKGLQIGQTFDTLTPVPDLNEPALLTGTLFLGDARTVIGASWDEKGEVCIQQDQPLPASVLGIIVEVVPGDTGR